jgi:hypothetical protein
MNKSGGVVMDISANTGPARVISDLGLMWMVVALFVVTSYAGAQMRVPPITTLRTDRLQTPVWGETDSVAVPQQAQRSPQITHGEPRVGTTSLVLSGRVEPLVIRKGIDTYRFMLQVQPVVQQISIRTNGSLVRGGSSPTWLPLFDDGTHGDDVSGDKTFTLDSLSLAGFPADPLLAMGLSIDSASVEYDDGSVVREYLGIRPRFAYIDPAVVPLVPVSVTATGIRSTEHCLGMDLTTLGIGSGDLQSIANVFFFVIPQDKDFLFVEMPAFRPSPGISGFCSLVSNAVSGLGLGSYDYSSAYGSQGKLQAVIGTYEMSVTAGLLNHELLHRWAVWTAPQLNLGSAHWSAIVRPASGFGGYWGAYTSLEHVGGTEYRGYMSSVYDYSDLELYLMGLIDASSVASPIRTLVDPVVLGYGYDAGRGVSYRTITASSVRDVAFSEIVAAHGPRIPGAGESQKHFSGALIVAHDRPLTDVEFAYFDFMMREYGSSSSPHVATTFQSATAGSGTFSTQLLESPVPITLSSFTAEACATGDSVTLRWRTLSEIENYGFEIERDTARMDQRFAPIPGSFIPGHGTSNLAFDWTFVDREVRPGMWSYRLKQTDLTGAVHTFGPVSVTVSGVTAAERVDPLPTEIALSQNFPNPFNPATTIRYSLPRAMHMTMAVYNALGQEVALLVNGRMEAGHHEVFFDASRLTSGAYVCRLQADNFTTSRVMLLLK